MKYSAKEQNFRDLSPKRLYWCTVVPMPYLDDFFRCASVIEGLVLHPVFLARSSKIHPLKSGSGSGYNWVAIDSPRSYIRVLSQAISEPQSLWLIAGWGSLRHLLLALTLAQFGRKFWLFTDTPVISGRSPGKLKQHVRTALLKYLFKSSEAVIGTGTMAVERLRKMGLETKAIISLPYPLDEKRFPVVEQCGKRDKIEIVFSGRIHLAQKRYDLALTALRYVLDNLTTSKPVILKIAGTGPDEADLRGRIKDLHLEANVEVLGWLEQSELVKLYQTSDIYFHPADFEPYGVTVVEALYCGLYTVASDNVGAAVELVSDSVNGNLFRSGDEAGAAKCLLQAVELFDTDSISKQQVRAASQKWVMDAYLHKVEEIFRA